MSTHLNSRIRRILETTPGLTQKGLAERMGLNPAAVNRMLYGRRNIRADEIPVIEDYIGMQLDLTGPAETEDFDYPVRERSHTRYRGLSDVEQERFTYPSPADVPPVVPVYGYAAGSFKKELNFENGAVLDWVPRHPAQFGIKDAFAVYVSSDSMEPRYFQGELVYIHPTRPPEPNRDCVIELKSGDAYIKRFVHQTDSAIHVAQFNPPQEKEIPKDTIKGIYIVVGRG